MTAPTHITFAQFVYLFFLTMLGIGLSGVNALVVAGAAVMPDLDTEASLLGKTVPPVSRWIERRFGHRTLTHSCFFIVALALLLLPMFLLNGEIYFCFLVGYASHPVLDSMTVHGVRLFYPFSSVRCVFPLDVKHPHRYRAQTGSRSDHALGIGFLLACIPAFFVAQHGHERLIRSAQKNIISAVREYNELSRSSTVLADVKAYNLTSRKELRGTFTVTGALDDRTLLVEDSTGRLTTIGVEHKAEYVCMEMLCRRGVPVRTEVEEVDMVNRPLGEIVNHVGPDSDHRLFGELLTDDRPVVLKSSARFNPVTVSSGKIRLSFATLEDIRRSGLEDLFITGGVITVQRTIPIDSLIIGNAADPAESLSRPFHRLSIKGERVELFCAEGDTVTKDQLLARERKKPSVVNEILLVQEKIRALEEESMANLSHREARLQNAAGNLARDSSEATHARRLVREGYMPASALSSAEVKVAQSRFLYQSMGAAMDAAERKYAVRRQMLMNDFKELRASGRELRSPSAAVLKKIDRLIQGGKDRITITLHRQ
jgi:inner membrane protein